MSYLIQVTGPDPEGHTEVLFKTQLSDEKTAEQLYADLHNQFEGPFTVSMIEVKS